MNQTATIPAEQVRESTYPLLVHSEEKTRGVLETVVYVLFILSAVFSIWQFAQQPITLPNSIGGGSAQIASNTAAQRCPAKS